MNNTISNVSYLRTSRSFPTDDVRQLSVELSKSYIDIANVVNSRVIGIFAMNRPNVTGESWFFTSARQQSQRQVYTFTATGNIPHGLTLSEIYQISPKSYGSFTDGTNWYGTIYASSVTIAGEVTFYVTPTNIVVLSGAGAPVITKGTIVLEWINNP